MSTDGRPADAETRPEADGDSDPVDLESASFVRLISRADGDALAASGLLAQALAERGTPFQVTVRRTVAARTDRARTSSNDNEDVTLVMGTVDDVADATVHRLDADDRPATLAAVDRVRELGTTPDLVLALAGLVAAGVEPGAGESEWVLETAQDRGLVERRPGVAIPTTDPADGLAHATRACLPWSGDVDAARDALADVVDADTDPDLDAELDADAHRAIGSLVALEAVSAEDATDAAATTIQRILRPYATPEGPFETIGGYADVLEATARTEPGTGAALAMGHEAREPALDAWREYGRRAHDALESGSTGRYDGLSVLGIEDGPVEAVARLAAGYRSPEPTVLVVGDGEAAIATREDATLGGTVEGVARELEAEIDGDNDVDGDSNGGVAYDVGRRRGYLQYDPTVEDATIITTVREFR